MDDAVYMKLKECKTVKEMFALMEKTYDMDIVPGEGTKVVICQGFRTAVSMLQPKKKSK